MALAEYTVSTFCKIMSEPLPKKAKRDNATDTLLGGVPRPPKASPFMRMSLLLMEPNDHNLTLAKQVGVTDIVLSYPGSSPEAVKTAFDSVAKHGLRFSVIERLVPHSKIMHGLPGRDEQIENFKTLMRSMAAVSRVALRSFCATHCCDCRFLTDRVFCATTGCPQTTGAGRPLMFR